MVCVCVALSVEVFGSFVRSYFTILKILNNFTISSDTTAPERNIVIYNAFYLKCLLVYMLVILKNLVLLFLKNRLALLRSAVVAHEYIKVNYFYQINFDYDEDD